jgi:hypothetical protein
MNPRAFPQQAHSASDSMMLPVETGSGWYLKVGISTFDSGQKVRSSK